jgi:hypothetical protein
VLVSHGTVSLPSLCADDRGNRIETLVSGGVLSKRMLIKPSEKNAVVTDKRGYQSDISADPRGLVTGSVASTRKTEALQGWVGDCSHARNLMAAIGDVFTAAADV